MTATSAATVTGAKASCALDGSGATVSGPKVGISGQSGVDVMGAMIKLN